MPLYEMLVLMKVSEGQVLAGFIKGFVNTTHQGGGVLRNVRNLGERIAAREYKDKQGKRHHFIRFLTFDVDCDPNTMAVLKKQTQTANEALAIYIHKLNMNDYYKQMVDRVYFKKFEALPVEEEKEDDYIARNTAREIVKKIKEEKEKNEGEVNEEDIYMRFGIKKDNDFNRMIQAIIRK